MSAGFNVRNEDVYTTIAMGSTETMHNLMLDALRRGILITRGCSLAPTSHERINLVEQKKHICQNINQLTREQKIQVLLAIVHIAGFEAIGEHNNGCLVDISDWDATKIKRLSDVIQFTSK